MRGPRRANPQAWATAVAAAVVSCVLLMTPVLFFGAFALRTSLEDLNSRIDLERGQTATLSAALVGKSLSSKADVLRLFSTRSDVRDGLRRRDAKSLTDSLALLFA